MANNENLDSFIFYRTYFEVIESLSETDGILFLKTLCNYALDKKEIKDLPININILFKLVKPTLDNNIEKYEKKLNKDKNKNNIFTDEDEPF